MSRPCWKLVPFVAATAYGQLGQTPSDQNCRHGRYDNATQRCICDKHWATAGITDTVDFLEGVCEQFRCQSDEQCAELIGPGASCPVKNWNCYCGWGRSYENGYRGFETNRAECMGLMYTFSVWTTRKVLDVYEHAWKVFLTGAILCLAFGRKRSRCDHHDISLWNDLRAVCGVSSSCNGGCPMVQEYNFDAFCDEFAWSFYILSLMVWLHLFLLIIFMLAFFVWSVMLWAMVVIILVVAAIAGLCVLCGCAGAEGGGADCCDAGSCDFASCGSCGPADCCCCFGDGTVTGGHGDGLMYWSGPYPYESGGCNCCYPTSSQPQPGGSSCCYIFVGPLAWLVKRFPRTPDNVWGGLLGRWMGTHRLTSADRLYQGGNPYVDFFSLQWMRTADLHGNTSWRDEVSQFLLRQAHGPLDGENSGDFSELEHSRLMRNDQQLSVGLATCITINRPFDETDGCVQSSFDDYADNVCWICQKSNDEWDLWLTCRHMFCKNCSTEMLRRRMPCPLCRRASTVVQRGHQAPGRA